MRAMDATGRKPELLSLRLAGVGGQREQVLEPVPYVRIVGHVLLAPQIYFAAVYKEGYWRAAHINFELAAIEQPVLIRMQDGQSRSVTYGPFHSARIAGGSILATNGVETVLATFSDVDRSWGGSQDGSPWRTIELTANTPSALCNSEPLGQLAESVTDG